MSRYVTMHDKWSVLLGPVGPEEAERRKHIVSSDDKCTPQASKKATEPMFKRSKSMFDDDDVKSSSFETSFALGLAGGFGAGISGGDASGALLGSTINSMF